MINLIEVCKTYKTKKGVETLALNNVTLNFNNNKMHFILGKSGSGKSTLLNIIGGLDNYDSGDMLILDKNTKNFKTIDFDNYRNNYVGFIFQEFNIIEDYTVYENIVLALNLQNKKVDENKINNLLTKLEIIDYKTRKINELSGGQKQRVAIARALIKEPKIILADEPTGNLDSKTGVEIMNLLKEISKTTLVIIVSHNKEFAYNYGDRIIEIEDGKIIKDTFNEYDNECKENYKITKTRLPFKDAFKLALKALKCKKAKLFFTIVLTTFSVIFLLLTYIMNNYSVTENHLKMLKDNNIDIVEIKKYTYSQNIPGESKYIELKNEVHFNNEDTTNILNRLDKNDFSGYPVYEISTNYMTEFFDLNIYVQKDMFNDEPEEEKDEYTYLYFHPQIIELSSKEDLIDKDIIGNFPIKNDEIVISNYLADMIIKYGIHIYESNEVYYPKDYNELVNSNNKYKFGENNYAKITGVINYNLDNFQSLKNKYSSQDVDNQKTLELISELHNNINNIYNKVYVKKDFINSLIKNDDETLDKNNIYSMQLSSNINLGEFSNVDIINGNVLYFDGKNFKETSSLNKKEMLVALSTIIDDYPLYVEKLNQYISMSSNTNKLELEKEFLIKNYNFNNYIGETKNLEIYRDCNLLFETLDKEYDEIYKEIKIIGITGLVYSKNNSSLFSNKLLKKYINNNIKVESILLKEQNISKKEKILKLFPYNSKYSSYSIYSSEVERYNNGILSHKDFIIILSIIFLLFSLILMLTYIINSIYDRKKDIGILKSLGSKNGNIKKIFIIEEFIICSIIYLLSIIGSIIIFNGLNKTIMYVEHTSISPFYINLKVLIVMLLYIFFIALISTIIPLNKIFKLKPIDAINKK